VRRVRTDGGPATKRPRLLEPARAVMENDLGRYSRTEADTAAKGPGAMNATMWFASWPLPAPGVLRGHESTIAGG